jgi:hypothetical protein
MMVLRFGCELFEEVDEAVEGSFFGGGADLLDLFTLDEAHGGADEVSNHRLDVSSDVTDFGEFGGFDLDEGGFGELGEAAGDFGFTDARRTDHEDVFGEDVIALFLGELLAAVAVAQSDGDSFFGGVLADDVFVELGDGLTGG